MKALLFVLAAVAVWIGGSYFRRFADPGPRAYGHPSHAENRRW